MTFDSALADWDVCYLETTGRVTGRAHIVEIWFAAQPGSDRIYMMSGGRDAADWVRNIRRNPTVRVRFGDLWLSGRATEIEGAADEPLCRQSLAAKYQGWREGQRLSRWARESLPIAIDLAA
jgi:deazaflavin-dependent oxidoreductase (nitroreductase family)